MQIYIDAPSKMHSDGNVFKVRGVCFKVIYSMTNQSLFQLLNAMVGYLESIRLACGRSGFDPRSGQTSVVKTGSDSSTAKCLATGVRI